MEPLKPLEPDLPPAPVPDHEKEKCPVTGVEIFKVRGALLRLHRWEEQMNAEKITVPQLLQKVERNLLRDKELSAALNMEDNGNGMNTFVAELRAEVQKILGLRR